MSDDQQWETEQVQASKPADVVISTRFPAAVAERVFEMAQQRGVRTSQLVRDAIDAYLEAPAGRGAATNGLTVSVSMGSASFVAGDRGQQTTGMARELTPA